MKLYEEPRAPNPRRVRIFLAEKGIAVPRVSIDINKMEHKTPNSPRSTPSSARRRSSLTMAR